MELNSATKKELLDPAGRARLCEMLSENGVLPNRTDCADFVQLMADRAEGMLDQGWAALERTAPPAAPGPAPAPAPTG